jgi:hypothetical protein
MVYGIVTSAIRIVRTVEWRRFYWDRFYETGMKLKMIFKRLLVLKLQFVRLGDVSS